MNQIIYPFNDPDFLEAWDFWKEYKKEQHSFKYKSVKAEQMALKRFFKNMNQDEAINAIEYSIANGWKGIFPESSGNKAIRNQSSSASGGQQAFDLLKQRHGVS